jgi:phosphatidylinositol alpha-1,6-mannosyltransferase
MPSPGGIERVLYERARSYRPEAVTVITQKTAGSEAFDMECEYAVVRTGSILSRLPGLRLLGQTIGPIAAFLHLRRRRPFHEIECGQAFPFGLFALLVKKVTGVPYVVWVHGNDFLSIAHLPLVGPLLIKSLRCASRIIANSSFVADLVENAGVDRRRIRTFRNIVDTELFCPAPPSPELRARYGLEGRRVVLTVARLVERKGIDSVIRCLPELAVKHPDIVYLVVGEGPMEKKLRQLARNLNVERHVVFAGAVSNEELPLHYHLADVFIMVSRYLESKRSVEGLGVVYLEAGACGLPVVAGDSGGVSDVVEQDRNGLLVEPDSQEQITEAVDRLLGDSRLASSLGRQGRALACRPTDWSILEITDP